MTITKTKQIALEICVQKLLYHLNSGKKTFEPTDKKMQRRLILIHFEEHDLLLFRINERFTVSLALKSNALIECYCLHHVMWRDLTSLCPHRYRSVKLIHTKYDERQIGRHCELWCYIVQTYNFYRRKFKFKFKSEKLKYESNQRYVLIFLSFGINNIRVLLRILYSFF